MLSEKEKKRVINLCFDTQYNERDIQEMKSLLCKTDCEEVIDYEDETYNVEELLMREIFFQEEWNEYNLSTNEMIEEIFN